MPKYGAENGNNGKFKILQFDIFTATGVQQTESIILRVTNMIYELRIPNIDLKKQSSFSNCATPRHQVPITYRFQNLTNLVILTKNRYFRLGKMSFLLPQRRSSMR